LGSPFPGSRTNFLQAARQLAQSSPQNSTSVGQHHGGLPKTIEQAQHFEQYLKSGSGHVFAKRHFWMQDVNPEA
jgi:hypothetical protein